MKIDVYSATGTKKGSIELPATLFGGRINQGLMHQFVIMQQSNRRVPSAHAKNRGEVAGSTRKLFQQKGTGRARRGSIRSPLLRGGGKAFGPRSIANFLKDMPKTMRKAALVSSLSFQAKNGVILGLESFGSDAKTKTAHTMLSKMPVDLGRRILIVMPDESRELALSVRNIPGVKAIRVDYLNVEDVLNSRHIVFLTDAIKRAEEIWGSEKTEKTEKTKKTEKNSSKSTPSSLPAKAPAGATAGPSSKTKKATKKPATSKTAY